MEIVIAKFNNRNDANDLAKFARTLRGKIKILNDEQWEDFVLGKLIDNAERDGGEVPIEKILCKLKK